MNVQWTSIADLLSQVDVSKKSLQLLADRASQLFSNSNASAQKAWAMLPEVPKAKLRTQLLQALKLSGLSEALTEDAWRKFLAQPAHSVPSGLQDDLFHDALEIAATRINDVEWPPLNNHGDDLIPYRQAAQIHVGDHWCMAFVYWCVGQAARNLEAVNPLVRTGWCKKQWEHVKIGNGPLKTITIEQALKSPSLVKPGAIFIYQYGEGRGHTGFVEKTDGRTLITIEGNTNPFELPGIGLGVFRCVHRTLDDQHLVGFIQL
jgi:hypothetical protein